MVEYQYEPGRNLPIVSVTGVVTDDDFDDAKFPDVAPGTLELMDLSAATEADISNAKVGRVSDSRGCTRL